MVKKHIVVLILLITIALSVFPSIKDKTHHKRLYNAYEKMWPALKVEHQTIDTIALSGTLQRLKIENGDTAYVYLNRVYSCSPGGCSIATNTTNKKEKGYEFFDYFIILDKNVSVLLVDIYNYKATEGIEITSKSWLKQFIGYNGSSNLEYENTIDAISGATISAQSLIVDIEESVNNLKRYIGYGI